MTLGVRSDLGSRAVLVLGGLVLGVVLSSGSGVSTPAFAQQAGGQGLFAVTAPGQGQGSNVLYVMDPATLRLAVFEHRAGGKIELTAVRNMEFDLQFQQWPAPDAKGATGGSEPPVKDMKDLIQRQTPRAGG